MGHDHHPYRSVLYMPGSNPRALEKARTLAADALIFDLEDAVLPSEKPRARELVAEAVRAGGYGPRKLIVRVNALDTDWGLEDLAAICAAGPDAVLLPKVGTPDQVREAAARIEAFGAPTSTTLWAMMETPLAVLNARDIAAAHPRLAAFVLGTNDLAKDLGAAQTPDRLPLVASLSICLLAARAYGLLCIDGVYNALQDDEGLRASCTQAREFGFDGKTLIHPRQLDIANTVFAPSPSEIALARRQVEAFEAARRRGEAVAVLDGRIVENLHAVAAHRLLDRAEAIAGLEELVS